MKKQEKKEWSFPKAWFSKDASVAKKLVSVGAKIDEAISKIFN